MCSRFRAGGEDDLTGREECHQRLADDPSHCSLRGASNSCDRLGQACRIPSIARRIRYQRNGDDTEKALAVRRLTCSKEKSQLNATGASETEGNTQEEPTHPLRILASGVLESQRTIT